MKHLLRRKTLMVSFLVQVLFIFVCILPIYVFAAEQIKPTATAIGPMPAYKMSDLQIIKQPTLKIPAKAIIKLPPRLEDRKADLSCTINTYYDLYRTKPIQSHTWDMSTAATYGMPYPWAVNWEIIVMNNGTAGASNFRTNLHFTNPSGSSQPYQNFSEVETLMPGEAVVFKYYFHPVYPGLIGKNTGLEVKTDYPPGIAELNEGNNNCSNLVYFVQ